MRSTDRCVFYISTNIRYSQEANRSASSLIMTNPGIEKVLFTIGHVPSGGLFDLVVELEDLNKEYFYLKHCYWMTEALQILRGYGYFDVAYADCDTYFCENVDEAFDMLEEFDVMGAHAPARRTCGNVYAVSHSFFPEINIGFVPMRTSENVIALWEEVCLQYEQYKDTYGNNDQGPFRDVLWNSIIEKKVRFLSLPPEWNCRFDFPVFVAGEVKVLHGRNKNMAEIARKINQERGMRSWKSGELGF